MKCWRPFEGTRTSGDVRANCKVGPNPGERPGATTIKQRGPGDTSPAKRRRNLAEQQTLNGKPFSDPRQPQHTLGQEFCKTRASRKPGTNFGKGGPHEHLIKTIKATKLSAHNGHQQGPLLHHTLSGESVNPTWTPPPVHTTGKKGLQQRSPTARRTNETQRANRRIRGIPSGPHCRRRQAQK
jgi:hypothetical protein